MQVTVVHPTSHMSCKDQGDGSGNCECCPVGRSGHRIIASDNFLYAVGGFNPAFGDHLDYDREYGERGHPCLFKEVWKFNLSTKKWRLIDDFKSVPPTIASHTIAVLGRWLFMFGGTAIPFGATPTSSIYRYDLLTHLNTAGETDSDSNGAEPLNNHSSHWAEIPVEGTIPHERYGHTMTLSYPNVYIVGGTSGYLYNSEVYQLDMSSPVGKWTKLSSDSDPQQPVGRYRHETAFDGDNLYVFGGGTDRDAFLLKHIHTFDVSTGFWKTLKSYPDPVHGFPEPRKCHSCCQLFDDVFLAGGVSRTSNNQSATPFDDIWRFSIKSASWSKCPFTLPQPLYFHSAAIVPERGLMYIFGGVTTKDGASVRTNQVLQVKISAPSLLEMAWSVLCKNLHGRWDDVDLAELGVPHQFHARICD